MDLITIEQARSQCHADPEDDAMLRIYAGAAERRAQQFLNRRVFASASTMAAEQTLLASTALAAEVDYNVAKAAAEALQGDARAVALETAAAAYATAMEQINMAVAGIVVNDDILAGMLLILGHLYRNREAVLTNQGVTAVQLPMGAYEFLWPYRIGLGV